MQHVSVEGEGEEERERFMGWRIVWVTQIAELRLWTVLGKRSVFVLKVMGRREGRREGRAGLRKGQRGGSAALGNAEQAQRVSVEGEGEGRWEGAGGGERHKSVPMDVLSKRSVFVLKVRGRREGRVKERW